MVKASLNKDIEFKVDNKQYKYKAGEEIQIDPEDQTAFDEKTGINFDISKTEYSINN